VEKIKVGWGMGKLGQSWDFRWHFRSLSEGVTCTIPEGKGDVFRPRASWAALLVELRSEFRKEVLRAVKRLGAWS
jgi:hypothetical protein